ncbi:hypothetical protein C8A01DRAFT_34317 [Parachaetomium inaequale]|uniref:C2H2-type domain-containing protein n=1 Tax=Parachaetomium inaequale TaxID=2588326 RepID=A0AAN6PJ38_9PEZI|nr:hypothetical protein C8A01DRAFT_34317 [Parachaetomium inaequale]
MGSSPTDSNGSGNFTYLSGSPSLSDDFALLDLQQTPTDGGGVGTTAYLDASTSSSFASSPGIMTPASTDASVSFVTPLSPTAPATEPSTPETPVSDQDSDSSSTSSPKEYRCTYPKCKSKKKVFTLQCQLRKHQNNHTRPWKCRYCTTFKGGAERKDLARHVRTRHPDLHEVRGDKANWKEVVHCERCGKEMRADNLKRHLKTCAVGL